MTSRDSVNLNLVSACLLAALAACAPEPPADLRAGDIQGRATASPCEGRRVMVSGVVTAIYPGDPESDLPFGFVLQDEVSDGDAATSDAVFVMAAGFEDGINPGDAVRVSGVVGEYDGETRIEAASVELTGEGSVSPTELAFPVSGVIDDERGFPLADLEALEGMLVRIDAGLTVADTYNLERFGSVLLHEGGRAFVFTSEHRPDIAGYRRHQEAFAMRTLVLDDGSTEENLSPIRYLDPGFDAERPLRVGDTAGTLTGVLRFLRGSDSAGALTWRLMPTEAPSFTASNPRPEPPPKASGSIRVAGVNALNFFSTIDADNVGCGPNALGCRGADSSAEFSRQRDRLFAALVTMQAGIIGLLEIENDDGRVLGLIAEAMTAQTGHAWCFIKTGTLGGDAIKVGLVFDSERVRAMGSHAILDASVDPAFIDNRNRPVLAQTFEALEGGERFTVVVNHLKSKGSDCNDIGDADRQDGQGNCNLTRTRAAEAEIRWLASDPTSSDDPDVLVIGDLNAYSLEDPVQAFVSVGYVDLVARFAGDPGHSFVFRGQSGSLDHGLASASLARKVSAVYQWHSNADEPGAIDYNLDYGRDPGLFEPGIPYRSSDHDPVIIDLESGTH